MRQVMKAARTYWNWVDQIAESHTIPENKLREMVEKGHFRSIEAAESFHKRTIKTVLIAAPIVLLISLLYAFSPKEKKASTPTQTNQTPVARVAPTTIKDFKEFLPPEDVKLKQFIFSDGFLEGFLGNAWIGYANPDDLLKRGFYLNTLYKYTGEGTSPEGKAKGACSPIGFHGAFICNHGTMSPSQWGIQNDEAIRRLNVLEEMQPAE